MNQIERVIINFSNKCNQQCPYCFIPFDDNEVNFNELINILTRLKELDIKTLTFGGSDPFSQSRFSELLQYAYDLNFEIHVDTNAIAITSCLYKQIKENISLLGLSLDGSTPDIHFKMRKDENSFFHVNKHIVPLVELGVRVKVNTVASRINQSDLVLLAKKLNELRITTWSLYQFMPLHGAAEFIKEYSLSDINFNNVVKSIQDLDISFKFEPSFINDRRNSYFFITTYGQVYTHNPNEKTKYVTLGNVFDDKTIELYNSINNLTVRNDIRYRYKSLA